MGAVTGRIDRKYMAHFIDAGSLCKGETPKYERLGKDLEEYNVELNPDTETSKNINGESTFNLRMRTRIMQTQNQRCLISYRRSLMRD